MKLVELSISNHIVDVIYKHHTCTCIYYKWNILPGYVVVRTKYGY